MYHHAEIIEKFPRYVSFWAVYEDGTKTYQYSDFLNETYRPKTYRNPLKDDHKQLDEWLTTRKGGQ